MSWSGFVDPLPIRVSARRWVAIRTSARASSWPLDSPLIVALDQVQDPQNLGSICRTAECAGVTGVVIPERRAAEVTPAACKASAGAVEHVRIARVRNIADFLGEAREAGCWSYGASALVRAPEDPDGYGARPDSGVAVGAQDAGAQAGVTGSAGAAAPARSARSDRGHEPVPYTAPDYSGGVVLVLGSEGSGLRPRVAGACDQLISLPLRGQYGVARGCRGRGRAAVRNLAVSRCRA